MLLSACPSQNLTILIIQTNTFRSIENDLNRTFNSQTNSLIHRLKHYTTKNETSSKEDTSKSFSRKIKKTKASRNFFEISITERKLKKKNAIGKDNKRCSRYKLETNKKVKNSKFWRFINSHCTCDFVSETKWSRQFKQTKKKNTQN